MVAGCRQGQCSLLGQVQECQQPGRQRRAAEEGMFWFLQRQQQHRRQHLQQLVPQQRQLQQGLGPVSSSSRLQHSLNRGGGSGMAGTPCSLASGQRRRSRPWHHNRVVAAAAQQHPQAHPDTSGVLHRVKAVSNSAAATSASGVAGIARLEGLAALQACTLWLCWLLFVSVYFSGCKCL